MTPWLLFALTLAAQDPVQVNARFTAPEIEVGETTTLRVQVETDGARARIEDFRSLPPGLDLVGTSQSDQRQFSMPGGTQRFITRDFVIRARAPGRYRVPAVRVTVGAQTYSTAAELLTVTGPAGTPAPARTGRRVAPARGAATRASADGVVMRAELEADTVFVGQQVTMNVDVMFSQDARLRLRRAPEYQPPSPSGFWVHDLADPTTTHTESVGGELYEVQTFRRAFFPLSPGRFEIPPAQLDFEIRRGLLYAPETSHVATDSLPLVVRPLPEAGRPDGFTGAVGHYTVRSWLEPDTVPAGEAAVLNVEVRGRGNVKALPPPTLPDVPGIERFPPTEEAEAGVRGDTVAGWKRFSWVIIPRRSGERSMPEVRYPYFDPDQAKYHVATAPALTLAVGPGATGDGGTETEGPALRYLRRKPAGADSLRWVRTPWFRWLQLGPLVLLVAALSLRRRRSRNGASLRALRHDRRARLRELADLADAGDISTLAHTEAFTRSWLARRLGLAPRGALSRSALSAAGVSTDAAAALQAAMDRLASARYAPEPPDGAVIRDIVRQVSRVLELIDREAPPPATLARPAGALLPFLVLSLCATGARAQDASPPPRDVFESGVRAFDAGRYEQSARVLRDYVDAVPGDAAAWYDLGTAYERAGRRGEAVWAWLRALRLSPRSSDIRHNLRAVGVAPELVSRVTPPLFLRPEELWLMAALGWWAAAVGAAWWLACRNAAALRVALAATTLAVGAVLGAWASTHGEETLIVLEPTALRGGPNLRGDVLTALEPGTGLELVERSEDWVRARTRSGEEGWVEARAAGTI